MGTVVMARAIRAFETESSRATLTAVIESDVERADVVEGVGDGF